MARLSVPTGVAVDSGGNVYIADRYTHRIRKVSIATGLITTVVGTANSDYGGDGGAASAGQLQYPYGVAVDGAGSVYVADTYNHRVRKASVPPATLTLAVVRSGSSALAYWTPVPGASSYVVYRGTPAGAWVVLANGVGNTAFLDSSAALSTTYITRVATVVFGETSASNYFTFRLANASSSGDVDGDGRADVMIYRPSLGTWYALRSGSTTRLQPL